VILSAQAALAAALDLTRALNLTSVVVSLATVLTNVSLAAVLANVSLATAAIP
jgi:hypothetical protein